MTGLTIGDIEHIAVLIQTTDGAAHQVLASKTQKQIFINLLSENGELKVSKELKPITFEEK